MKQKLREIYRTLTPQGWLLFITLVLLPFILGFVSGYSVEDSLIKIQSRTNGMEHTTNYKQLHYSVEKFN